MPRMQVIIGQSRTLCDEFDTHLLAARLGR